MARESSTNLHQTTGVARNHGLHPGPLDGFDLLIQNRYRNLRIFNRERSSKTATCVSVLKLHKFRSTHMLNETARFLLDVQVAQTMAGVVPGYPSGPTCTNILNLQHSN